MRATVPAIESTFLSLDFIYVPTADVDSTARHYVEVFQAELLWKVRGMGTGRRPPEDGASGRHHRPPSPFATSDGRRRTVRSFPSFVETMGGAYLFVPSMRGLE